MGEWICDCNPKTPNREHEVDATIKSGLFFMVAQSAAKILEKDRAILNLEKEELFIG